MHEATVIDRPRTQLIIERPRLTKLLDEAGARIILLLAPAGYGKTTLAQQWTRPQERVDWYAGGRGMIDVAGLSVGMAEVLGRMGEPARSDMVERVRILAARGHDPRGLAKAVSGGAPGADWLLVLDDYHHALDSADAEAFLEELVALTEFRLLITSRERPSWLPARKVVYGEAAVVEMDALAFTDEEALLVLGGRGEEIVAEAHGWPAVIGLAAMRGGVDVTSLPPDELYRFFAEDLFQIASPQLQEALFLIALAGVAETKKLRGQHQADLVADATERGFITSGDEPVVHPLLRSFLLAKLDECGNELTDRLVKVAVNSLVESRKWDECLSILERFPSDGLILSSLESGLAEMLDSGRIATIRAWLALAARVGLEAPLILLAEAEVAFRDRNDQRALALGERAGSLLTGDLSSRSYLVAAFAAHFKDRPNESARLCDLAFETATSPRQRLAALWLDFSRTVEQSAHSAGPLLERLQAFTDIDATHALRLQTAKGLTLCQNGDVGSAVGELELAEGLLPEVRDPFARTNLLHFLTYTYLLGARYQDVLEAAERLAEEARDSGLRFAGEYAVLRRTGALIGLRRLGNAQAAIESMREPSETTADFITSNVVLQRVRLAITVGDFERAIRLLSGDIKGGDRPAFRGEVRAYTALVAAATGDIERAERELRENHANELFVEPGALGTAARAILLLRTTGSRAEAAGLIGTLFLKGEVDAVVMGYRAWPHLAQVCVGTELEPQMAALLGRSKDLDIARIIGLSVPRELRPRETLSPREQEVCDLLAQGLGNRAIARALFISESTTKVHIRHIFEKLGVHSRAEAVRVCTSRERA